MTTAVKISSCVDCETPIIGDRLRCPACHDLYAAQVSASEDDVTAPRHRGADGDLMPTFLMRWIVAAEVIAIVGLALVLMIKGCVP